MFRFLSILLISSYFLGTLGLKVNQHYCCGKVVAIELLFGQKPKDCSGKVPKEPKKCCKDEVKILQSDDAKQSFSGFHFHSSASVFEPLFTFGFHEVRNQLFDKLLVSHFANGPPLIHSEPLFLLHRSLLI